MESLELLKAFAPVDVSMVRVSKSSYMKLTVVPTGDRDKSVTPNKNTRVILQADRCFSVQGQTDDLCSTPLKTADVNSSTITMSGRVSYKTGLLATLEVLHWVVEAMWLVVPAHTLDTNPLMDLVPSAVLRTNLNLMDELTRAVPKNSHTVRNKSL
ncbi:hypothetical protein KEM52_003763 [Ascosphaera acerosa]|nr:hypothetical protein KEM52_003763 [Ascosphaera acerosa]